MFLATNLPALRGIQKYKVPIYALLLLHQGYTQSGLWSAKLGVLPFPLLERFLKPLNFKSPHQIREYEIHRITDLDLPRTLFLDSILCKVSFLPSTNSCPREKYSTMATSHFILV